jgi:hypothetical protein
MTKDEIPAFVQEVADLGCPICALSDHESWFIGDSELPDDEYDRIREPLSEIDNRYGCRDHLNHEIIAYLRSIGRIPDFQKH